jgi:nucleotide-binding universal stress UspA family protein
MKILLAVDGSVYTSKSVKYLAAHLEWFKDEPELHLLHVKLPIPAGRVRAIAGRELVERYYREEADAALAPAEKVLRKFAIPFQRSYRVGDIAKEIQAYASRNKIDMIVMGSHGHGALKNLVMGSVATKVLAATKAPVLIVR